MNHAWNRIDRHLDFGAFGSIAAVVTQPSVGLRADGRGRYSPPHCYRPRASRTYLESASIVHAQQTVSIGLEVGDERVETTGG